MPPMPSWMLMNGCTGFRVRDVDALDRSCRSPFANHSVLPSMAEGPDAADAHLALDLARPARRSRSSAARSAAPSRAGADDEERRRALPRRRRAQPPASLTLRRRIVRRARPAEARRSQRRRARVGRDDLDGGDGLGEPLHALEPALAVADALHGTRELQHGLAREHLARAGERAQPRGEVERAAAVAVRDRHGLAGVEPDADTARQAGRGHLAPAARSPSEAPAAPSRRRRAPRRRAARSAVRRAPRPRGGRSPRSRGELGGGLVTVLGGVSSCTRGRR